MKTGISHVRQLKRLNACKGARKFAAGFPSLQAAWDACERGDWMLWLLGKQIASAPWSDDRKPLLAVALDCAQTVQHLWRPATAEDVAVLRKWIAGEVGLEEAMKARKKLFAADAVYAYVYADAAVYAAAVYAAAADAVYAAYAAVYAAAVYAAAADAVYARKECLKKCADIVRCQYPIAPEL